ncbi:cytidine deaminase 1-like [Andrographis paniculata]|uniref:cytidine deaminase 1-like n=1 Tax=Andrographis paniculata TaxID=175694 RepID=UPI0021E8917B|nr:cytidine deaminase 1-like [Andrographis paniculata]
MDHLLSDFVIGASAAESMAEFLRHPTVVDLLPHLVPARLSLARPPISNFKVAAVGLGADGRVFVGVNLEFPGLPLHHSVHAEQFLITNLLAHGCPGLTAVAVSAAPCGHCRQFLQELRNSSSLQILVLDDEFRPKNKIPNFMPLSEFLPIPFGPHDLLDHQTPFLLENQQNKLDLLPETNSPKLTSTNGNLTNKNPQISEETETLLREAALDAANRSHAPYSGCPSGVALMDCEGKLYKGSYVESAAYNPSLGPVQAALVAYVAAVSHGGYERIVAAVLVEKEGAKVKQEDTARLLLKAVSPKCEFHAFHCQSSG